jgi:hypothetical protein
MQSVGIKTGASSEPRDQLGGNPLTGQAVSGIEATRAWSAAFAWNVGRHALIPTSAGKWAAARGSVSSSRNCKGLSTVAGHVGGPARSSAEASVTGAERRGRIIRGLVVWPTGVFREEPGD